MATSTIAKTHARNNHSRNIKPAVRQQSAEPNREAQKNTLKARATDDQNPQRQRRLKLGDREL